MDDKAKAAALAKIEADLNAEVAAACDKHNRGETDTHEHSDAVEAAHAKAGKARDALE